jgi:hypothetical protein
MRVENKQQWGTKDKWTDQVREGMQKRVEKEWTQIQEEHFWEKKRRTEKDCMFLSLLTMLFQLHWLYSIKGENFVI